MLKPNSPDNKTRTRAASPSVNRKKKTPEPDLRNKYEEKELHPNVEHDENSLEENLQLDSPNINEIKNENEDNSQPVFETVTTVDSETLPTEELSKKPLKSNRRVIFADEAGGELVKIHSFTTEAKSIQSQSKRTFSKEIKVKQFAGPNSSVNSKGYINISPTKRKKVNLKKTKIEAFRFATDRRAAEKKEDKKGGKPDFTPSPPSPTSSSSKNVKRRYLTTEPDTGVEKDEEETPPPSPQSKPRIMLSPLTIPLIPTSPGPSSPKLPLSPSTFSSVKPYSVSLRSFMSPRHSLDSESEIAKTVRVVFIPLDTSKEIYERSTTTINHHRDLQMWLGGRYRCQAWHLNVPNSNGGTTHHRRMLCSRATIPNAESTHQIDINTRVRAYFPSSSLAPRGDVAICSYMMNSRPLSTSLSSQGSGGCIYWIVDYDVANFKKDVNTKVDNMNFGGINNSDWHTSSTGSLLNTFVGDPSKPTKSKSLSALLPTNRTANAPQITGNNTPGRPSIISLRSNSSPSSPTTPALKGSPTTPQISPLSQHTGIPVSPGSPSRFVIGHQRLGTANTSNIITLNPIPSLSKINTMRTLNGVSPNNY
jgi:hypothetical protein